MLVRSVGRASARFACSPLVLLRSQAPVAYPLGAQVRAATSKAGGSTRNGRDSKPKYLGVKKFGGEAVKPGDIIVRQRGQRYGIVKSTKTVAFGRDWTIYALQPGYVKFWWHAVKKKNYVEVVLAPPAPGSAQAAAAATVAPGSTRHPAPLPAEHKYPIVRVRSWELPGLLSLPADTRVSEGVLAQLHDYVQGLNPFQRAALLPRGRALIGGLDKMLAAEKAGSTRAERRAAATAAAAAPSGGGEPGTAACEVLVPLAAESAAATAAATAAGGDAAELR